jgi:hypothetical protein
MSIQRALCQQINVGPKPTQLVLTEQRPVGGKIHRLADGLGSRTQDYSVTALRSARCVLPLRHSRGTASAMTFKHSSRWSRQCCNSEKDKSNWSEAYCTERLQVSYLGGHHFALRTDTRYPQCGFTGFFRLCCSSRHQRRPLPSVSFAANKTHSS